MDAQKDTHLFKFGGIAGIIALVFLAGVAMQQASGWFPEYDLEAGTMTNWLDTVSTHSTLALTGIGCSVLAILMFLPFGWILYKSLSSGTWLPEVSLLSYLLGSTLALAAFTFGFGFTWALIDLSTTTESSDLAGTAAMGMRGFLFADDMATLLIGMGHLFASFAALRSGFLPKWLCWWGIIAGILVGLVLLRYLIPVFSAAAIGYPLVILWFFLTGIVLIRKSKAS